MQAKATEPQDSREPAVGELNARAKMKESRNKHGQSQSTLRQSRNSQSDGPVLTSLESPTSSIIFFLVSEPDPSSSIAESFILRPSHKRGGFSLFTIATHAGAAGLTTRLFIHSMHTFRNSSVPLISSLKFLHCHGLISIRVSKHRLLDFLPRRPPGSSFSTPQGPKPRSSIWVKRQMLSLYSMALDILNVPLPKIPNFSLICCRWRAA